VVIFNKTVESGAAGSTTGPAAGSVGPAAGSATGGAATGADWGTYTSTSSILGRIVTTGLLHVLVSMVLWLLGKKAENKHTEKKKKKKKKKKPNPSSKSKCR
jgi:ascorbate-specific PTS system EIIC-type component UlaA